MWAIGLETTKLILYVREPELLTGSLFILNTEDITFDYQRETQIVCAFDESFDLLSGTMVFFQSELGHLDPRGLPFIIFPLVDHISFAFFDQIKEARWADNAEII